MDETVDGNRYDAMHLPIAVDDDDLEISRLPLIPTGEAKKNFGGLANFQSPARRIVNY